ncbi:hypothetical protein VSK91_10655 [Bacillus swezeyi]|uniref:hypothetical protein n=1 Tax=Bacillus swezeyi TaxID=1925020 RepID=UPI00167FE3FF|nr:hypothetical protein [Bacillus swezeyi]
MKKSTCVSAVMLVCLLGGGFTEGAFSKNEPVQTSGKSVFPDSGLHKNALK